LGSTNRCSITKEQEIRSFLLVSKVEGIIKKQPSASIKPANQESEIGGLIFKGHFLKLVL